MIVLAEGQTIFISSVVAVVCALVGSGGVVFSALRFNRDEAGKVVSQQSQILDNMRALYEVTRQERDQLRDEVERLRGEVTRLRRAIERMNEPQ